jgi:hypothetical protein
MYNIFTNPDNWYTKTWLTLLRFLVNLILLLNCKGTVAITDILIQIWHKKVVIKLSTDGDTSKTIFQVHDHLMITPCLSTNALVHLKASSFISSVTSFISQFFFLLTTCVFGIYQPTGNTTFLKDLNLLLFPVKHSYFTQFFRIFFYHKLHL